MTAKHKIVEGRKWTFTVDGTEGTIVEHIFRGNYSFDWIVNGDPKLATLRYEVERPTPTEVERVFTKLFRESAAQSPL